MLSRIGLIIFKVLGVETILEVSLIRVWHLLGNVRERYKLAMMQNRCLSSVGSLEMILRILLS